MNLKKKWVIDIEDFGLVITRHMCVKEESKVFSNQRVISKLEMKSESFPMILQHHLNEIEHELEVAMKDQLPE